MWTLTDKLNDHFAWVEAQRKLGSDDDGDEIAGPVIHNEHARGRGRDEIAMADPLLLNVQVIWEQKGLSNIIAEAQRQISRLQAAGYATPENISQISQAAPGAAFKGRGGPGAGESGRVPQSEKAGREGTVRLRQCDRCQTKEMQGTFWTGQEVPGPLQDRSISAHCSAGHNAALDAAEQREIQIETLKAQLGGKAAEQIAEEIRLRRSLERHTEDDGPSETNGGTHLRGGEPGGPTALSDPRETLDDHPERIGDAARASLDDRLVELKKRQLVAEGAHIADEAQTRSVEKRANREIRQKELDLETPQDRQATAQLRLGERARNARFVLPSPRAPMSSKRRISSRLKRRPPARSRLLRQNSTRTRPPWP